MKDVNSPCFRAMWLALCTAAVVSTASRADWPTYRYDFARGGVTEESIDLPLRRQWVYRPAHAPEPAWPEPGRELNRLAFDYAFAVTIADGLVYFGSSADHKVYALDLATGKERWAFFTEGPVRFAPALAQGRVFVASDDGWVYCLSGSTGDLIWRVRGGPGPERLLGNGRMISRWPLRAGVAVENGIVYLAAGMWPAEGVYISALRAADGTLLWRNDTSGSMYLKQPHPGSFSMTGVAPQGYILGRQNRIFVPTGRNVPAAYDQASGELLYYRSAPTGWGNRWGGSWNFLTEDLLFSWSTHVGPDLPVMAGEYQPDPNDGLIAFDARTSREKREMKGKLCAVSKNGIIYAAGRDTVGAYRLRKWVAGAAPETYTVWEIPLGRVYSLILAGNTLIAGGPEKVSAMDIETGKTVWRDAVEGQVRALAASAGRLLVSTTTGEILCYGSGASPAVPAMSGPPDAVPVADDPAEERAKKVLDATGAKAGLCLLLGAGNGIFPAQLAARSDLTIYCLEDDEGKVNAARRTLDAMALYGTRVTMHLGTLAAAGYPGFFADLIVPSPALLADVNKLPVEDIYRVLRPCGGVAYFGDLPEPARRDGLRRRLLAAGVPEKEIRVSGDVVQIVRGKLPLAADWSHQFANAARAGSSGDERVRLPLRMLWFGEPGPATLVSRHWGGPAPLTVNGRLFVIGQRSITTVDAYNGRPLWKRDFPRAARWPVRAKGNTAAADQDSVYLVTGKSCLRLDAASGETLQTYAIPPLPEGLTPEDVKPGLWSYLAVSEGRLYGSVGTDTAGNCIFALRKTDGSALWILPARGTVGNNAFAVGKDRVYVLDRPDSAASQRAKRRGQTPSVRALLRCLDAATGAVVWESTEGIGARGELWLSEDVLLATGGNGMTGFDADTGKRLYTKDPSVRGFPVLVDGIIYSLSGAFDLRTGVPKPRVHPLTGEATSWAMSKGYGCGAISASTNLLMFRSATLGFYDLTGDSGVHNYGGVRAGCFINAIAAGGLVLVPPADAACTCSYSLRTTVVLAPAEGRRDWSIFYDRLPNTTVRQAAMNLGAPGDRRDPEGRLWLAMPRPGTRAQRQGFAEPFRFSFLEGFGAYRESLEAATIEGSERPWLYTNGLKGLQRLELDLDIYDRGYTAWPVDQAPTVDGALAEACWDGYRALNVARDRSEVMLRYDARALYVGYRRRPVLDAAGRPRPWRQSARGDDAAIWQDDSFELFFGNLPKDPRYPTNSYVHLGVSASGSRYDAAWNYVSPYPAYDVPRLDVAIDGNGDDWGEKGLVVHALATRNAKMWAPDNFDQTLRIGWTDKGLAILVRVRDNAVKEYPNVNELWRADSVEIFMTHQVGMDEGYQIVLGPGADPRFPKARKRFYDRRRTTRGNPLTAEVSGSKTPDGYLLEALLPWNNLKIKPATGREFGLQVFVNDDDTGQTGRNANRVMWHPGGHPASDRNPRAYHTLRLAAEPSPPSGFTRAPAPGPDGIYAAATPLPFPLQSPPMGIRDEDPSFSGNWAGAAKADPSQLTIEMAIPWSLLAGAGLRRGETMVSLAYRGPLTEPPYYRRNFERIVSVPAERIRPRQVTLRLHFAELENVAPEERLFDIKLDGKVVVRDFDVMAEAGGTGKPVVKDIGPVTADRMVVLELVPKAQVVTGTTAPILSALELRAKEVDP